jgi:antitoxin (DNA-binding transcriptional repressor) of toxin-antitoxin stability system
MDVSVDEVRERAADVVAAVERGEQVVLVRDGEVIGDLSVPRDASKPYTGQDLVDALERIHRLREALGVPDNPHADDDYDTGLWFEADEDYHR